MRHYTRTLHRHVASAYLIVILGLGAILHDIDYERGDDYALSLTVVTSDHESATGIIAPFGPGFERELLAEFCKKHNCDIRWLTADSREAAAVLLRDGMADVAIGFGSWSWRAYSPSLHRALTDFWQDLRRPDNLLLAQLEERYYGYLPAQVDEYAVTSLMRLLSQRLPRYSALIAKASDGVSLNPLLFTAVIIQESRLDEETVSPTGVRGIMQLTQITADFLKVDRMDPEAALRGGARYLHRLWKDLEPLGLAEWDRWFFALAAFNQGPRRLEGAMELSRKLGGTGRTWTELRRIFPLLSQKKYADMIGQNPSRGQEAVDYVDKVRFFYHILRSLVTLDRPEAQYLTPLLRGLDWNVLGF